ncbi:hypothetical protein CC86DRAFT_99780 [Ophiobolus disseminans]|uniref:F-box domain-containing protein n=1 Tax=Ophiobolus disseminans TaxID=1469910 RepID=A0A6A6ZLH0_9PLEO|nr:hypothetical protein CC86DRAFT_99780 [Ophiobolus disseminans]
MELYRPYRTLVPRSFRQLPAGERFSVADAAQLKLTLQALDDKIEHDVDVQALKDACKSRPFHEEIYVDGSEEFFLLIKSIMRPDLIPSVYIEAYETLRQGRYPWNHYRFSDVRKGIDPIFSQVRSLLARLDELCGTKLDETIRALEDTATPFPFLRLPAELRLQIYAHHLPREDHIALLHRPPRELHRDRKPPHINLAIMRANHQLHNEITKYFYEKRTLFIVLARDKQSRMLSDEYVSRYYETLAAMSPYTRQLFTKVEFQVGLFAEQTFEARRHVHVPSVTDPMHHVIALLPNLTTVVLTFPTTAAQRGMVRIRTKYAAQISDTLDWLLSYLPNEMQLLWDLKSFPMTADPRITDEVRLRGIIESRGPVKHEDSVTRHLSAKAGEPKCHPVFDALKR